MLLFNIQIILYIFGYVTHPTLIREMGGFITVCSLQLSARSAILRCDPAASQAAKERAPRGGSRLR